MPRTARACEAGFCYHVLNRENARPLRAGLVSRAEDWPWSSLGASRVRLESSPTIANAEILRRSDWPEFVNAPMTEADAEAIRLSIRRDRPYGSENWTRTTAARLGLESSLRSPGNQRLSDPDVA